MLTPSVCIWKDLDLADATQISLFETPHDIKSFLQKKFNLQIKDGDIKEKIILDLYYHLIVFAKENNFNEEQTSAFFSIVKRTHNKSIETPYGNMEESFQFFKDMVTCHSVKRPPFYIHLFNIQQTKHITEYVLNTYFKHFKLYKYAFTPKVMMDVSISYQGLKPEEESVADVPEIDDIVDGENEKVDADITEGDEKALEENDSDDDDPAMKELKKIIRATLDEQINKLKLNIDQKMKLNEESLLKKVSTVTGREPSAKGGKKGGKKK